MVVDFLSVYNSYHLAIANIAKAERENQWGISESINCHGLDKSLSLRGLVKIDFIITLNSGSGANVILDI
jgi:hypothetical protein